MKVINYTWTTNWYLPVYAFKYFHTLERRAFKRRRLPYNAYVLFSSIVRHRLLHCCCMSATDLSPIASMRINRWLIGGKKQHHFIRQQSARTIYTHVCAWDESDWVNVGRWSIVIIRNPITNQSCHPKATASSLLSSWLYTPVSVLPCFGHDFAFSAFNSLATN